jgi:hypothetical protein
MKRKLTNFYDDLSIINKETSDIIILNDEKGNGLYSRSWCGNFREKAYTMYYKCSDLEEFKTGIMELWFKLKHD